MRIRYLAGISFSFLFAMTWQSAVAAKITEEDCKVMTPYEVGVRDGARGASRPSAASRLYSKQCLKKYDVTFDKSEYLKGTGEGFKSFCTEEQAIRYRNQYREPTSGCMAFDNPYRNIFNMPDIRNGDGKFVKSKSRKVYQSSKDQARQELSSDIALLKTVATRARNTKSSNPYAHYSYLASELEDRITDLEKLQSGQSLIPVGGHSPGPKYREGMSTEEMISGIFKASNWKSGDENSPKRIRKKQCKAGEWESYGEQHGSVAAEAEEEIAKATKKCAKHKATFDEATYLKGYNKAVSDYCGYEQGFFNGLDDETSPKVCASGRYPTYSKGYKHGEIRAGFVNADSSVNSMDELYGYVLKAYAGKSVAGSTALSELNVPTLFGNRTAINQLIANERIRIGQAREQIDAHKAQYPTLYQDQETGVEPRPDRMLDYPIPN